MPLLNDQRSPNEGRALIFLMALAFLVRLYGIELPLTDGGHERQTFVAMIARNLLRDGMNILYPRVDIFGPDHPGYVFYELPLQPWLMAWLYKFFGIHDVIGRLTAVFFSVASIPLMLRLSKLFLHPRFALFATAVYALSPLSIYMGRSVFPEALFMFFALAAFVLLMKWYEHGSLWDSAAAFFCAALCFLLKPPPGLVLLLPFVTIWWMRYGNSLLKKWAFYLYFSLMLCPMALWALWGHKWGVKGSLWNPYQMQALKIWGVPDYWFRAEFYTHTFISLVVVALTPAVAVLALYGLKHLRTHRYQILLLSWTVANAAYVILTPLAQCNHWHYQLPLIPLGAIIAGFGLQQLCAKDFAEVRLVGFLRARPFLYATTILIVVSAHLLIYEEMFRVAYNPIRRVPYAFEVADIVQNEFGRDGFLLLIEPNMVPLTQTYLMDRQTLQIPSDLKSPVLTIDEVEKWRLKGAVGIVAVNTPYGNGVNYIRQNEALTEYLGSYFRPVKESDNYLIWKLK